MVAKCRISGVHYTEIDVTGGIGLKAARAAVATMGIDVFIVGEYPERLFNACRGVPTIGTQIFANDWLITGELFIYRVLVQCMVMTWLDTR